MKAWRQGWRIEDAGNDFTPRRVPPGGAMLTRAEKRAAHARARAFVYESLAKAAGDRPVMAVQVGANDGQLSDPLFPYFAGHGWHGLLLEPNPVYFARLGDLHAARPHVVPRQVGCSSSAAEMTLFYLDPDHEDLYRRDARGCATLDRARMRAALEKERADVPEDHIAQVTVHLRPLDAVLADEGITTADVLVIDVEGHEPEVLAGCDLAALSPRLVVVEQNTRSTRGATLAPLRAAGFRIAKLAGDVYAFAHDYPDREGAIDALVSAGGTRVDG